MMMDLINLKKENDILLKVVNNEIENNHEVLVNYVRQGR